MKERITITIDQQILNELDAQIDGTIVKNRSHAVELSLAKSLQKKGIKQAVILAGGNLTVEQEGKDLPPFLVKINNRTIIEHNILMLRRQGIKDFIVTVGEYKDEIIKLFSEGNKLGINIIYVEEKEPLGTAGILRKAAQHLSGTFIVCNSHELKEIDVKEMLDFHRKQRCPATIAITTTPTPKEYGVVVLNGNQIYSFIEKPQGSSPTNLISAGFYIFEPEVIKMAPEGYGRLELDIFPKLAANKDLAGFIFYGKWQDVRSPETLAKALKW
jgi:NDP-sugar pyrophosphorylase family protein